MRLRHSLSYQFRHRPHALASCTKCSSTRLQDRSTVMGCKRQPGYLRGTLCEKMFRDTSGVLALISAGKVALSSTKHPCRRGFERFRTNTAQIRQCVATDSVEECCASQATEAAPILEGYPLEHHANPDETQATCWEAHQGLTWLETWSGHAPPVRHDSEHHAAALANFQRQFAHVGGNWHIQQQDPPHPRRPPPAGSRPVVWLLLRSRRHPSNSSLWAVEVRRVCVEPESMRHRRPRSSSWTPSRRLWAPRTQLRQPSDCGKRARKCTPCQSS
mmetsp:Transcript_31424/g.83671  ORF Transcript_31424/g.83671 Transcript_31424/m.83671 type:complete len:274 (-) Transcript_31424:2599-3420(-)